MNDDYQGDCCDSREIASLRKPIRELQQKEKKSRIADAFEDNERAIEMLRGRVVRFLDKLSPVLKPENPVESNNCTGEDRETTSEMARAVEEKSSKIRSIAYMIEDAEARLEV